MSKSFEWYDGEIQAIVEKSGKLFYALCVDFDFFSLAIDRSFLVIPIEGVDREALIDAFASKELQAINQALVRVLDTRCGGIAQGEVDSWEMESIGFDLDASAYRRFFRFPLIDFLAGQVRDDQDEI